MRRIALVTGTTSGIGAEVAVRLARAGWELVLWNRSPRRSAVARRELLRAVPMARVTSVSADLSSPEQVVDGLNEVAARVPHLDLLVNNAGLLTDGSLRADDGSELQFRVHVLAAYELMVGLRPLLARAPAARVLNISSGAQHLASQLMVDELREPSYRARLAGPFAQTKLALSALTAALAPVFQRDGTALYSVDPGATRTRLTDGLPAPVRWLRPWLMGDVARAAERVMAAVDLHDPPAPGSFLTGGTLGRPHPDALDPHLQYALLALVAQSTGRCLPDVSSMPCAKPADLPAMGGVIAAA